MTSEKKHHKKHNFSLLLYFIAIFIAGIIAGSIGIVALNIINFPLASRLHDEIRSGQIDLINPLLECNADDNTELRPMSSDLESIIEQAKKGGRVRNVSLVFRDFLNQKFLGLYTDEDYVPASLLKVPVLIAFLKAEESDPELLNTKIKYDASQVNVNYVEQNVSISLENGKEYSLKTLLEKMIINSDNAALNLLGNFGKNTILFDKLSEDLGISVHNLTPDDDFIGVVKYSSFFRILYNASYLNQEISNYALNILTKVKFNKGITKDLPAEIKVAHKYGIRTLADGINEFHDCGIVYFPKRPYLLCIMTKGTSQEAQEKVVQDLSKKVYSEIVSSVK